MEEKLNEQEVRILGCLVEKDRTTPDYYPLSLNALVNACNQKSNRSPVVSYNHDSVAKAADSLRWKGWAVVVDEAGSRTEKYRHCFLEKSGLGEKEMAVLAELMLRGPQTLGEIRGRASRMFKFAGIDEVQEIVAGLGEGENPWVLRLPRQKGRKERRFAHLLAGPPEFDEEEEEAPVAAAAAAVPAAPESDERLKALEDAVESMKSRIDALEKALDEFRSQFE